MREWKGRIKQKINARKEKTILIKDIHKIQKNNTFSVLAIAYVCVYVVI